MRVSVLLRFFIAILKFATLLSPSSVYMSSSIFKHKYTTMGPMIPKEKKYNLHYGDVRGDVLPLSHGTNKAAVK